MGARSPTSFPADEAAFQKIAADLGSATSPKAIDRHLEALIAGLADDQTGDDRALQFLRAGGLPPVIRHLRGAAASHPRPDPNISASSISARAGQALCELLLSENTVLLELQVAKGILLPLIDALCNAPHHLGRTAAAMALGLLAQARPDQCRAMAEADVFQLLFKLFHPAEDWGLIFSTFRNQAGNLVCELLCSRLVGARELERVIREPGTGQAVAALVLLQDCLQHRRDDVLGTVVDAGVVKAMVATLEHKSPYCVAAAAGALWSVGRAPGRGQALFEASGAIPALVRILRRPPRSGDPDLFPDATFKLVPFDQGEPLHCNDPIPVALASLSGIPHSNRMLSSFLKAGGVAAIVRLLRESTCPATLGYTLDLMTSLVMLFPLPGSPDRRRAFATELHRAGISKAALDAFNKPPNAARGRLIHMLYGFFAALYIPSTPLSKKDAHAALGVLVRGNMVELTVNYMTEAPVDMHGSIAGLLLVFTDDPEGKRRLGDRKLVDPLIQGVSKWLREGPQEAGQGLLITTSLIPLFSDVSPGFLPAAIMANFIEDLIRLLQKICPIPQSTVETPAEVSKSLEDLLSCLRTLLMDDAANQAGTRKSVLDGSLLVHLINLHDSRTLEGALGLVNLLVVPGPCVEIQRWAECLPRAVAGLLSATPPLVPATAANTLFRMGTVDRGVMLAYSSWGIDDALRQLTRHSDPGISGSARGLLALANEALEVAEGDVDPDCHVNASLGEGIGGMGGSPGHREDASSGEGTGHGGANFGRRKSSSPGHRMGPGPDRRLADAWACAHCRITDDTLQSGKLKECSGCRSVRYCGQTCQKAHWLMHKATCKQVQAAQGG